MKNTTETNEGGTDFQGLQDFLIDVDTSGYESQQKEEVEIDLGDQKEETLEQPKEEQVEQVEQPKEEEKTSEETPKVNQTDSYYGKLASKFIEKGKWQDAELELEDGKVVKLSELEDIDEDLFFQIEESQSKFTQEDIKDNYISKKDLDENKLKLIEIVKEGGDLRELFKTPEEAKRPFEGVDVEDDKVQKTIFFNYLTQVQNLNPEDAKVILNNHEKRGELEPKVKEIVEGYQAQHDKKIADKLESLKAERLEREQRDKEFSKSLEEIYKGYNLDNKLIKRFSTLGTERTKDGDFELDNLYSEKLEKPEEAAELIFFLTDKEGYLKSKMTETRIGTQKENLRRINLLKDKQRKDGSSASEMKDDENPFIIEVK